MASVSADYDPLNDDEERQVISPQRKVTLPKVQIAVLMVAYFAQPVAITIIYPFIPKLVIDLHLVDGDTSKVGYYSGLFDALPLLSEAIAVLYWTRFSDIYGRRRVLLCGAAGLACSLTCFGLSRTLLTIVLSRTLQGAVDANTAMIKTMLGEIADGDEAVMARLFSFIPIVWASGSTLAPLVGGWLQHPAERFPRVFTHPVWIRYPFLLPCLAAASVPTVAFFAVLFFLKYKTLHVEGCKPLPSYGAVAIVSKRSPRSDSAGSSTPTLVECPLRDAAREEFFWMRRLVVTLLNYAVLEAISSSFYALIALFFASPIASGGLGLEPAAIGSSMALMGLMHGTFQAFFFVHIHQRVDPRKLFRISMISFTPLYLMMPAMNLVARRRGVDWVIGGMLFVQAILFMICWSGYCTIYVFVTRAAPNRSSLARTNGLSEVVNSLCSALGPTLATILFALTKEHNLLNGNLVYFVMVALSFAGVVMSTFLPSRVVMKGSS